MNRSCPASADGDRLTAIPAVDPLAHFEPSTGTHVHCPGTATIGPPASSSPPSVAPPSMPPSVPPSDPPSMPPSWGGGGGGGPPQAATRAADSSAASEHEARTRAERERIPPEYIGPWC